MHSIWKKAGLAVALGATALTVAAPAEAQRWHHNRHHGGDDAAAAALVGGIIGLGIGAAIASSDNDRYDNRYYNDRYYDDRGYYDRDYYAPQPRYSYRYRDYRPRSEDHTSELQSLMRLSYAVFCLKKKKHIQTT